MVSEIFGADKGIFPQNSVVKFFIPDNYSKKNISKIQKKNEKYENKNIKKKLEKEKRKSNKNDKNGEKEIKNGEILENKNKNSRLMSEEDYDNFLFGIDVPVVTLLSKKEKKEVKVKATDSIGHAREEKDISTERASKGYLIKMSDSDLPDTYKNTFNPANWFARGGRTLSQFCSYIREELEFRVNEDYRMFVKIKDENKEKGKKLGPTILQKWAARAGGTCTCLLENDSITSDDEFYRAFKELLEVAEYVNTGSKNKMYYFYEDYVGKREKYKRKFDCSDKVAEEEVMAQYLVNDNIKYYNNVASQKIHELTKDLLVCCGYNQGVFKSLSLKKSARMYVSYLRGFAMFHYDMSREKGGCTHKRLMHNLVHGFLRVHAMEEHFMRYHTSSYVNPDDELYQRAKEKYMEKLANSDFVVNLKREFDNEKGDKSLEKAIHDSVDGDKITGRIIREVFKKKKFYKNRDDTKQRNRERNNKSVPYSMDDADFETIVLRKELLQPALDKIEEEEEIIECISPHKVVLTGDIVEAQSNPWHAFTLSFAGGSGFVQDMIKKYVGEIEIHANVNKEFWVPRTVMYASIGANICDAMWNHNKMSLAMSMTTLGSAIMIDIGPQTQELVVATVKKFINFLIHLAVACKESMYAAYSYVRSLIQGDGRKFFNIKIGGRMFKLFPVKQDDDLDELILKMISNYETTKPETYVHISSEGTPHLEVAGDVVQLRYRDVVIDVTDWKEKQIVRGDCVSDVHYSSLMSLMATCDIEAADVNQAQSWGMKGIFDSIKEFCDWDTSDTMALRELGGILNALRAIGTTAKNVGSYIVKVCRAIMEYIAYDFMGIENLSPTVDIVASECKQLMDSWTEYRTSPEFDKYQKDRTIPLKVRQFRIAMDKCLLKLSSVVVPSKLYSTYMTYYKEVVLLDAQIFNMRKCGVKRQQPVWVHIVGDSGVGKTHLVDWLISACAAATGVSDDPQNVYTRCVETEFWDGYAAQDFVRYDETQQIKLAEKVVNEVFEFIRMVNRSPYMTHQADILNKGTCYFSSKFVFSTSNQEDDMRDMVINKPEAFWRRQTIKVVVKTQDGKKMGDYAKFDSSKWKFEIERLDGDRLKEKKIINAKELVELILTRYDLAEAKYKSTDVEDDGRAVGMEFVNRKKPTDYFVDCVDAQAGPLPFSQHSSSDRDAIIWADVKEILRLVHEVHTKNEKVYEMANSWSIMFHLAVGIGLASLAYKGAKMLARRFMKDVAEGESNDISKKDHDRPKPKSGYKVVLKNRYYPTTTPTVQGQGSTDTACLSLVRSVFAYAVGFIEINYGDGRTTTANAVFVDTRIMATVAHCFPSKATKCEIIFYNVKNGDSFSFNPAKEYRDDHADVIFLMTSHPVHPHRSVYDQLPEGECDMIPGNHVMLVSASPDKKIISYQVGICKNPHKTIRSKVENLEAFEVSDTMEYSAETQKGDCGSIVAVLDKHRNQKFYGIHIAGKYGQPVGYASRITKAMVDRVRIFFELAGDLDTKEYVEEVECQSGTVVSKLFLVEKLEGPDKNFLNSKTRIKKSNFYELLGKSTQAPAKLRIENGVSPYYKALEKLVWDNTKYYSATTPYFTEIKEYFLKIYGGVQYDKSILTIDQAISVKERNGLPSLDLSTSSGYPYNAIAGAGKSKYIAIDEHNNAVILHKILAEDIQERIDRAAEGYRVKTLWLDTLKDEKRDLEKVQAGKTRLFTACPLDYLIVMRMYFGKFSEFISKRCVSHPISVGIDVHSSEWGFLYKRLKSKGPKVIAGDFTNFDGKLPVSALLWCLEVINAWYNDGPVNRKIRETLWRDIYDSFRVGPDYIYRVSGGNPSGNPLTAVINSMSNFFLFVNAILDWCYKEDFAEIRYAILEDVGMAFYGDDNILTFNDLLPWTYDYFANYFADHFYLTYTHWTKKKEYAPDTLESIRYLGRAFIPRNSYIYAPLDIRIIKELLYWWTDTQTQAEAETANVISFRLELSHYPKDVYVKYLEPVLKKCEILHYDIPHLTYEDLDYAKRNKH